ncbi:hypothetical protein BC830DRAFT_1128782 [Chytriomyces sp. MP71]|nr:hypothetical protein BC830DRAFT_1128782 [Chytriomyces sp. MP71]
MPWNAARPKVTRQATPAEFRNLDNATLLSMEQASRKAHKKAVAKAIGSAAKIILKSPMAIMSIAKTGLDAHKTFLDHDDILKEVTMRHLHPLPTETDENIYILVTGQLIAVFVGHKLGEGIAMSVAEPLVTHFGGPAIEKMTAKMTELVAEEGAETILSNLVAKLHLNPIHPPASGNQGSRAMQSPPAPTLRPIEDSHPSMKASLSVTNLATMASDAAAKGIAAATEATNLITAKLLHKPPSSVKHSPAEKEPLSALQNGLWSGFAEELEIVPIAPDADSDNAAQEQRDGDFGIHAVLVKLATGLTHLERTARGEKKEVVCVARYRMKFEFQFSEGIVGGRNVVDDLLVIGTLNASGLGFRFIEVAKEVSSAAKEVSVVYTGRLERGVLTGEWVASDSRQGIFRLQHNGLP